MRQYIRHPSEIPLRYQVMQSEGRSADNHLQNISTGGLAFHCNHRIRPDAQVQVSIDIQPPAFTATGTVVWCNRNGDGYLIGLRFDDREIDYHLRMVEQVCHIEQYRQQISRREGRKLNAEQAATEWIARFAEDFPY